jgi:hypothetical protein
MKIAIDAEAWAQCPAVEAVYTFPKGSEKPSGYIFNLVGRTEKILAAISDDGKSIEIFPERSHSQRALREALGA